MLIHKTDNVDKSIHIHTVLLCKQWPIWGGGGSKERENKIQMIIRYPIKHSLPMLIRVPYLGTCSSSSLIFTAA